MIVLKRKYEKSHRELVIIFFCSHFFIVKFKDWNGNTGPLMSVASTQQLELLLDSVPAISDDCLWRNTWNDPSIP